MRAIAVVSSYNGETLACLATPYAFIFIVVVYAMTGSEDMTGGDERSAAPTVSIPWKDVDASVTK